MDSQLTDTNTGKPHQHPFLYFEDGDLELSAETCDGSRQLFRVYQAQLRRVSPVFRDMLALGGARDEVVVMPDAAEDIAALLESIYIPSSLTRKLKHTPPSRTAIELAGLVRAAKKYGVDDVADITIEHVEAQWPQSLEVWDIQYPLWMAQLCFPEKVQDVPEPVSAIRFGREFGLTTTILPAAYYMLAVQSYKAETAPSPQANVARWELADHEILLNIIRGRDQLRSRFMGQLGQMKCHTVKQAATCDHAKVAIIGKLLRGDDAPSLREQWDYLKLAQLLRVSVSAQCDICPHCKAKISNRMQAARLDTWASLPVYFGITSVAGT